MCVCTMYKMLHTPIHTKRIFNLFYLQVLDICTIHIDDVLTDISETVLIELPECHAFSMQELIDHNEVCTRALTNDLVI